MTEVMPGYLSGAISDQPMPRDFGAALKALRNGYKLTREGWNNKSIWIELQKPDENSKMTLPYIYMVKGNNKFPCDLSCESILAEDWTVVS